MLLKGKFRHLPLFKLLILLKSAHVSKLAALKVLTNIIWLSWKCN